jgi:hypothetical protein
MKLPDNIKKSYGLNEILNEIENKLILKNQYDN